LLGFDFLKIVWGIIDNVLRTTLSATFLVIQHYFPHIMFHSDQVGHKK